MKLLCTLPGSRVESNIRTISRKLKIRVLAESAGPIDGIIVVGDGSPDAEIVCIVARHLNESKTVGILKPPGKTGLSVIQLVPTYLKTQRVTSMLILLDQEEESPEKILSDAEKTLSEEGISVKMEKVDKRLTIYEWNLSQRTFKLILVINGLDEINTKRHSIEDHLVKTSNTMAIGTQYGGDLDSKEVWKKLRDNHDKVFKKLKEDRRMLDDAFPQLVKGLAYLKASLQ